jgi:mannose-6-phosphate isomerase-like protein (cupin superfamily)
LPVSEWRIAPNAPGPGAHSHAENDEVFLVTEGSPSVLVGDRWHSLEAGSVVVVPATIVHDFENRTNRPAALFNVFMPGGFEKNMPAIIEWFGRRGEV